MLKDQRRRQERQEHNHQTKRPFSTFLLYPAARLTYISMGSDMQYIGISISVPNNGNISVVHVVWPCVCSEVNFLGILFCNLHIQEFLECKNNKFCIENIKIIAKNTL